MKKGNRHQDHDLDVAQKVRDFYERHPYPPPIKKLEDYRKIWSDPHRRRADLHLYWPNGKPEKNRTILVAGCGTSQAAKHAMRWPEANVIGVDVSTTSIRKTEALKRKYNLENLTLHQLPIERIEGLGLKADQIICTGVLHHLPDPDAGLSALQKVLKPNGAMQLMLYAPYGRTGIYLLQDYCRKLGLGTSRSDIKKLNEALSLLPKQHPLSPMLFQALDFKDNAALADALLNPQDRAYSVPEVFDFLSRANLKFGRWVKQAPYDPNCGLFAASPHCNLLGKLPVQEQYAATELFRGTMFVHSIIAYHDTNAPNPQTVDFHSDTWLKYVPLRLPETICLRERLPKGAAAVLINRAHTFVDLFLPISSEQHKIYQLIDGIRTTEEIHQLSGQPEKLRSFFELLWRQDQIIFDRS
ncbi:class I SAM-dependent methyltransferase [Pseudohalocynthiibacter aestuariivivens]|uniref:Class I SAM-dependent methyltransferase n=1 Tax=Pseudohalocynthiibacter aestuariivivens TaxID=1591409 RepID=A0ABV5JBN0_9RHOB|nr:class I SAM-dependent methyltransferase [Pseudohalocynthiibacter aestuariivivens]MBS9718848.1 class I SAM-dependent methyltransferase [Pseudohalocynthiibacter aestuariivivens]